MCTGVMVRTGGDCVHRGDGTHRGLGGVIVRTHRGLGGVIVRTHRGLGGVIVRTHRGHGGVIVCMDPTGVVVRVWVLQGLCDGSYRGVGACTGVLVRVWVLQGLCDGSYRGVGACTGVLVREWVLQGWWYVHGSVITYATSQSCYRLYAKCTSS